MGLISGKLCRFLFMFSTGFTSLSVLLLFPLSITFSALCTVFDSISSNIDEVLLINPSANAFAFGDFNVHHKDWLTYSGGTDRSGELCHNFLEVFCKKGVLRNSAKFTGKQLCQSLFFNSLRPATLLKKRLWHRCFPVNFAKFLKTPFLPEHLRWLLLALLLSFLFAFRSSE